MLTGHQLCANTIQSFVSGTLPLPCTKILWPKNSVMIYLDFLPDGLDVQKWVENNEHWNQFNSLLGRILQAVFKWTIRENRNGCCTLLPRAEILRHGFPQGSWSIRLAQQFFKPRNIILSVSFVIGCLHVSYHTLPYTFFLHLFQMHV